MSDSDSDCPSPVPLKKLKTVEPDDALKAKNAQIERARRHLGMLERDRERLIAAAPVVESSKASGKRKVGEEVPVAMDMNLAVMVKYLRKKMDEIRPFVMAREEEDNQSFKSGTLPSWRDSNGKDTKTKLKNLEDLLGSSKDFLGYKEFVEITHHESLLSVLGGTMSYHSPMIRSSNKESATLKYCYDNLPAMLASVVRSTEDFAIRPEQLLAIAESVAVYDVDIGCSVRNMHEPIHEAEHVSKMAGCRPAVDLINYATGMGKTLTAILSSMMQVCDPALWAGLQASWKTSLKTATVQPYSGLSRLQLLDGDQHLTRVVLAVIPEQLMDQWAKHAEKIAAAMKAERGFTFHIWQGLSKLKRASKKDPLGVERTLTEAHKLIALTQQALLWIVPAKTEAAKNTRRNAPHLHYPFMLIDEGSTRTEPKCKMPESKVLQTRIVQATVGRLQRTTKGQPDHPLRKALNGIDFDPRFTKHAAIFHLLTVPDWLRLMVSKGMAPLMPSGIRKVTLKVKMQSLAARVNKSDLNVTSLDELLKTMLRTAGASYSSLTGDRMKEFTERCRNLLGVDGSEGEGGATIHERLSKAMAETKEALAAMPLQPTRDHNQHYTEEENDAWRVQLAEYATIDREKRVLNVMIRMFNNLAEAVCVDPPPECPITLDEIPAEYVGILPCCTNLFDARCRDRLGNHCPMCRAPLANGILNVSSAVSALTKPPEPPADEAGPSTPPMAASEMVDNEPALIERLKNLEQGKPLIMSSKAVAAVIKEFLAFQPTGARILLAFGTYYIDGNESIQTRRLRDLLKQDVPELTAVDVIHRKDRTSVNRFTTADDSNRVLFINTNDDSSSLEGLDLWNTGLVLIDRLAPGRLTADKIVQTVGRAMRPQLKTKQEMTLDNGPSPFPSKLVVLLDRAPENAPPLEAAEIMDEDLEEHEFDPPDFDDEDMEHY
jgi:hypothetical protein